MTVTPLITAAQLRDLVAIRLNMRPEGALPADFRGPECFGIWVCGDDVELELHFDHLPFEYVQGWSDLMRRYSNVLDQAWYRDKKKKRKEGKLKEPPCRVFFRNTALLAKMYERKFPSPGNAFHEPVVDLLWRQAHQWLLNAYYCECEPDECLDMAALYMQVKFGDYNESVHKLSFMPMNKLLSPRLLKRKKEKEWFALLVPKYQALAGRPPLICKLLYLQRVRQFKTHNATFYEGVYEYDHARLFQHPFENGVVVCVNADGVGLVDLEKMKHLTYIEWSHLLEWSFVENVLTLRATEGADGALPVETVHTITTAQAELIVELIDAALDDVDAEAERQRNEVMRQTEERMATLAATPKP